MQPEPASTALLYQRYRGNMLLAMTTRLQLTAQGHHGADLNRPECALAHTSGLVFAPCWHGAGGVSVIKPSMSASTTAATNAPTSGAQTRHVLATAPTTLFDEPLRPNGIALDAEGRLLMAHLGASRGAIFSLSADGETAVVVDTVEGEPMPPANFVVTDSAGRVWITVSTRLTPRSRDYRKEAATGFIAVAEPGARDARIVADGLGYTNECVIDEVAGRVYVNETFGRRLTVFDLEADASLSHRRVHAHFGHGTYPDGLALDTDGGLWVTSIVSNRILHVDKTGAVSTVFEDSDPEHVAWAEDAWLSDSLGRAHLDKAAGQRLKNVSNLAFGGPDLCDVWLGNLLGDTLPVFRSTVAGAKPVHWDVPVEQWLARFSAEP